MRNVPRNGPKLEIKFWKIRLGPVLVIVKKYHLFPKALFFALLCFPEGSCALEYDENTVGSHKIEVPQFSNKSVTFVNK